MASLDSPDSLPNPSFRILTPESKPNPDPRIFLKSSSTKEHKQQQTPSIAELFSQTISPPRFSTPCFPTSPGLSAAAPPGTSTSYRCISSIKKDGQVLTVAAWHNVMYTGSEANVIRVWKLPEFSECDRLKTKASGVVALAVSNDRVYGAYGDGKIRVWQRTWEGGLRHVRIATVPKSGGYMRSYIAGKDKMVKHMGPITSLAVDMADDILYSASLDKTIKVWRISDLKCIETFQAHMDPINAIVAAENGILYTASDDATVRVWRRNFCTTSSPDRWPHSLTITLPAKNSPVKALTVAPDSEVLYGGCTDGYVHFWLKGWVMGQLQYGGALQGHTHAVLCMASVGNYVMSGSADSTCRVWVRAKDGQHSLISVLAGHRGPVRCVAAYLGMLDEYSNTSSSNNNERMVDFCTICTGSLDGVIKLWRVTSEINGGNHSQCSAKSGCEYFEL